MKFIQFYIMLLFGKLKFVNNSQMNDILKGTEIPSKIKTLLQCAGIFEYLETLNDLQEIQDVSVKLSSALKLICQSQSEEFVISMCYEKDDKHERMAQVARDAMKNYQKIASLIKSIDVLNSFKCYVNYKASYCEMLSLLFSGIFYNKSDENGKAIAMVKHCKSKIDEHKKVTKCYLAELTDKKDVEYQLEWLTATIDRYLSKFNKENDLVYHQKVPDQVPEPCDEKAFGKIEKFQLMPVSEEWKKEIFDGFKFNDSFLPSNSSTLGSSDNSSKLIQPNSSGETDEKTEGKTDGEGVKTKEDDIGGCSLCVLL